ncbi:MAG: rhomboid family intramembrane serine protease [Isosphaeraceae bacterium]
MRQIGTLPRNHDPRVFGDYLLSHGIKSRFDERPEGWLVWIHNEDHVPRAAEELKAYLDRPDDSRFVRAAPAADAARKQEAKLDRQFRKNYREVTDLWTGLQVRRRPLTMALVFASIAVYILMNSPRAESVYESLMFTGAYFDPQRGWCNTGLAPILAGQVWRLVTPIFLHFTFPHILFNCWATIVEGTLIESGRGTFRLLILVLVSAILSNLGQHFYMEQADPGKLHIFGGLSGVGYAMFGYLWMKGQYEPEQGMILHPNTITLMLLWLVLCMTGWLGPIANAAHVVGLVVGVIFGLLRF